MSILPQHRELIEASGIGEEIASERGYFSVSEAKELQGVVPPSQHLAPALVIPIFNTWGEKELFQIRPDNPRVVDGRICKSRDAPRNGSNNRLPAEHPPAPGKPKGAAHHHGGCA